MPKQVDLNHVEIRIIKVITNYYVFVNYFKLKSQLLTGMKIFDISFDISPIYPISVMFDTISAMTDISWKCQVCGTSAR